MPYPNALKTLVRDTHSRLMTRKDRIIRTPWPAELKLPSHADARVGVIMASFNTRDLLALSLFALFRILQDKRVVRIVVVDNASTDGSRELLKALADADLVDVIFNEHQHYHGPALNQGVAHLRALHTRKNGEREEIDYIWVLDSDALVLRADVLDAALSAMTSSGACLAGQYLPDELAPGIDGYAHPSSLILDPARVWQRAAGAFDRSGAPAMAMQQRMIRARLARCNFPFMADGYVLHLGGATLRSIWEGGCRENVHYEWAKTRHNPHFHGNPDGAVILEELLAMFEREGAAAGTAAFVDCLATGPRLAMSSRDAPETQRDE